jgi:hypothetical protein
MWQSVPAETVIMQRDGPRPWSRRGHFRRMMAHSPASLSRTPKPRAIVKCGSYSNPNNGCTDERQDALAAYTLALAWYIIQDSRYAKKSIEHPEVHRAAASGRDERPFRRVGDPDPRR